MIAEWPGTCVEFKYLSEALAALSNSGAARGQPFYPTRSCARMSDGCTDQAMLPNAPRGRSATMHPVVWKRAAQRQRPARQVSLSWCDCCRSLHLASNKTRGLRAGERRKEARAAAARIDNSERGSHRPSCGVLRQAHSRTSRWQRGQREPRSKAARRFSDLYRRLT